MESLESVLQNSSHKSAFWPRERSQNLGQSSILLFELKLQVKNFCSGVFPFSWPSITPCQFSTTSKAIWLIYRQQILGTTFKKFFYQFNSLDLIIFKTNHKIRYSNKDSTFNQWTNYTQLVWCSAPNQLLTDNFFLGKDTCLNIGGTHTH